MTDLCTPGLDAPTDVAAYMHGVGEAARSAARAVARADSAAKDRALRAMAQAGFPDVPVSVNVSPLQLRRREFAEELVELLGRHGIAPHRLEIEITEGAVMSDYQAGREMLARLRRLGFAAHRQINKAVPIVVSHLSAPVMRLISSVHSFVASIRSAS